MKEREIEKKNDQDLGIDRDIVTIGKKIAPKFLKGKNSKFEKSHLNY